MNPNAEVDRWQLQWQAQSDAPATADLRDRVARETRRRKFALIVPVLVTLVIGGWTVARAILSPQFDNVVLAVETWVFIAVIWAGALWIDRGTSGPLGDTTTAFVDVSIRRCQSTLGGLRFGALMYVSQFLFIVFWKVYYASIEWSVVVTSSPVILLGWLGGPALFAFVMWYGRRKNAELRQLFELRRQLAED